MGLVASFLSCLCSCFMSSIADPATVVSVAPGVIKVSDDIASIVLQHITSSSSNPALNEILNQPDVQAEIKNLVSAAIQTVPHLLADVEDEIKAGCFSKLKCYLCSCFCAKGDNNSLGQASSPLSKKNS